MEGVASEACSLAGHLRLGKLIVLYDQNHISLAGSTSLAFTEDVGARFAAYGWHVQHVEDGNDLGESNAPSTPRARTAQPSIILVRTTSASALRTSRTPSRRTGRRSAPTSCAPRRSPRLAAEPAFLIPPEVESHFRAAVARGQQANASGSAAAGLPRRVSRPRPASSSGGIARRAARGLGRATCRRSPPTPRASRRARRRRA